MAAPHTTPDPGQDLVAIVARAYERDRYLASLLAERQACRPLMAIAAFAGEVARIPATVSEPMMGEIKLQWWRDGLLSTDPALRTGHPIADEIRLLVQQRALPNALLIGFVDAQELGLSEAPPADEQALKFHFAKTEGALFELALRIVAGADAVSRHQPLIASAAMACGLTRMMIEFPAFCAERRTLLPATLLERFDLSLDTIYSGRSEPALGACLTTLTTEARRHFEAARVELAGLSRPYHVAFLPLALVEPHLRVLEKTGRDPLRTTAEVLPLTRLAKLWWSFATGRF